MIRTSGVLLAALLLSVTPARANLENDVAICASPKSTPHDVVNFCRRAIESGSLKPQALAQVYANLSIGYLELEQYGSAVEAATRALESKPDLVPAFLNRAKAYEKQQRLREAAADYESAIRIDRNSAEAYLGRGIMLLRNGDPYRAIDDLTAAMSIAPDWGAPRFNRGLAYLDIGQMSRAAQDFSDLIRRNPDDAGAHLYRGQARARLNDAGAAEDFDRAIELAGEWPLARFVRGRYRDSLGDREGANADFLRAYELGYSDPWLIERVREISR